MAKSKKEEEPGEGRSDEAKESKSSYSSAEQPKRTNLGDSGTMKRMLDDAVIKVILDRNELNYEEDTALSNIKLLIGFAGVGASLISHIYPATFPKNWWVLLACCAFYFICSGVLQLLLSFVEIESILLVKPKKDADGKMRLGFNVSAHFPRFQEMYTIGLPPLPRGSLGLAWAEKFKPQNPELPVEPSANGFGQRRWSVSEFFDEDGFFHEEEFEAQVASFLKDGYIGSLPLVGESKKTN